MSITKHLRVIVVMPAYYAEKTLRATYEGLPKCYDEVILCDDESHDNTYLESKVLGITTIRHPKNRGYGGNQKTLYDAALKRNPDIIVMVHPDNQYETTSLPQMIQKIASREADLVLGTRMSTALKDKMHVWRYLGNRFLTLLQNTTFHTRLSEFHSGLRAYDARVFERMPYHTFSDNFVFDSEVIAWLAENHYTIGEVPTRCYYTKDVSSISLKRSIVYGFGTINTLVRYLFGYYRSAESVRPPARTSE